MKKSIYIETSIFRNVIVGSLLRKVVAYRKNLFLCVCAKGVFFFILFFFFLFIVSHNSDMFNIDELDLLGVIVYAPLLNTNAV